MKGRLKGKHSLSLIAFRIKMKTYLMRKIDELWKILVGNQVGRLRERSTFLYQVNKIFIRCDFLNKKACFLANKGG
jgi:hypothetical protein